MPRLKDKYRSEVVPAMMEAHGYRNVMQVPRLNKIVLNIGLGEALKDAKALESATKDLSAISGQHAVTTRSRRSIAAFRLRVGMPIGVMVTLRGDRMWEFLDRLVSVVLPRLREFQGISPNSFDGRGNYSLGFKEQIAFPEMDYEQIEKVRGLEVAIVTTAKSDEEGKSLLELLGMPFSRD